MVASTAIVTSFESNETDAGVTAALVALAPASGNWVITWQDGTRVRVAKITPTS